MSAKARADERHTGQRQPWRRSGRIAPCAVTDDEFAAEKKMLLAADG